MCGSLILQDFGILCSSFLTKRWLTVCEPPQHIFQNPYLADVEPAVALEIIACMMREHELDDQFDKVLAFVPKDEAHIKAFARHFAIAGIMRKLDEEAMEESLEEEMEEEPKAECDDHHCKG